MQGKVRWSYPVVWEDPDQGEIRFFGLVSLANEEESTFFNDWIPSDARSWIAFEAVKRRRDATR